MIDVKQETVEIQKLMLQTSELVPKGSKEKFQQLKLLDEIENRCNLCWYATDDERFYALSETVERMAESLKKILLKNGNWITLMELNLNVSKKLDYQNQQYINGGIQKKKQR